MTVAISRSSKIRKHCRQVIAMFAKETSTTERSEATDGTDGIHSAECSGLGRSIE